MIYNASMKQRKLKGSFKGFLIGAALAAVVVTIGFLSMNKPEEKTKMSSTTLKTSLEQASDLITTRYYYSSVGRFDNSYEINGWSIPFTGKNFLLTYQGEAQLGFPTSDLEVDLKGNTITVTCPPIQVLSNSIPSETVEVYDQSHNIFNPVTIDDYLKFETEQKQTAVKTMQENGTFARAQSDADAAIRQLLNMIPEIRESYTIEVRFKEPEPEITSESESASLQSLSSSDQLSVQSSQNSSSTQ